MSKIHKLVQIANDDEADEDDVVEFGESDDLDGLRAVARLSKLVGNLAWFSAVGRPLTAIERDAAERYVNGIGFPEVHIAGVENWLAASEAAQATDFGEDWWEAEEQMRRALFDEALQFNDEHDLEVALAHVSTRAGEVAHERAMKAAARHGVSDPDLLKVAAGAAAQSVYQAALVLAAQSGLSGPDAEHPFAMKFRLFESGRLPLGLVGNTFNLF